MEMGREGRMVDVWDKHEEPVTLYQGHWGQNSRVQRNVSKPFLICASACLKGVSAGDKVEIKI